MSLKSIVKKRKVEMTVNISTKRLGTKTFNLHVELYFDPDISDVTEHTSCLAPQIAYYGMLLAELENELANKAIEEALSEDS